MLMPLRALDHAEYRVLRILLLSVALDMPIGGLNSPFNRSGGLEINVF